MTNNSNHDGENTEDNDVTKADADEKSAISTESDVNSNSPTSAETTADVQQNNSSNEEEKLCRICHGTDEDEDSQMGGIDQEWVHPCKCATIRR
jgi:hypothetical protein